MACEVAASFPSFQLRTTGRCGEIECREGERVLLIPWEMSGSPKYDLLLAPLNLTSWSSNPDEPIPPLKQREVLTALRQWLRSERLRTDIDLPAEGRSSGASCQWSGCKRRQLAGSAYCEEHYDATLSR
jgi:hypothetical protein